MSNYLIYKNEAVGAKENIDGVVSLFGQEGTDPDSILGDRTPENYLTFEGDGFDLHSDSGKFFEAGDVSGFVSNIASDESGNFSEAVKLSVTIGNGVTCTSDGITITFWQDACTSVRIIYKEGAVTLNDTTYACTELVHFFEKHVEGWNSVEFHVLSTETPHQLVKIARIDFGRDVKLDTVYSLNLLEETSLAGDDLSINTLDFSFYSADPLNIQENQIFFAYQQSPGETAPGLIGKFNADTVERDTDVRYTVSAGDDVDLLDSSIFKGGMWLSTSSSADGVITLKKLLDRIAAASHVDIACDENLKDLNLLGYIPYGSCRKALTLAAFAVGAAVRVGRDGIIRLSRPKERPATVPVIPESRILGAAKFEKSDGYTGVELTRYVYTSSGEIVSILKTGKNETITSDDARLIKHSSPIAYYATVPAGHAEVESYVSCILIKSMKSETDVQGYKYGERREVLSKHGLGAQKNIKTFEDYTLYCPSFDKLAQLYSLCVETSGRVTAKIVLDGEQVGDWVTIPTKYSGDQTGVITSLDARVGNHLVAEAVIECLL